MKLNYAVNYFIVLVSGKVCALYLNKSRNKAKHRVFCSVGFEPDLRQRITILNDGFTRLMLCVFDYSAIQVIRLH